MKAIKNSLDPVDNLGDDDQSFLGFGGDDEEAKKLLRQIGVQKLGFIVHKKK